MKSHSRLIALFAFIFCAVACSAPSAPNSTGLPESVPDLRASIEAPQAAADTESNHAKEVEGLISVEWAKTPYRPEVYEGANHPDPHREAFALAFKNNGKESISAFKGTVRFLNVFEEEILAIPEFEQDKTILPGKEVVWTGSIQTLGNEAAENLYSAEHEKVKIVVILDMIIFVDGSRWSSAGGFTPATSSPTAVSPQAAPKAIGLTDSRSTVPRPSDPASIPVEAPETRVVQAIAGQFMRAYLCREQSTAAYVTKAVGMDRESRQMLTERLESPRTRDSYNQAMQAATGNGLVSADLPRLRNDVTQFCSQPLPSEVFSEGKGAYVDLLNSGYEKLERDYKNLHDWMAAH